ncbi:hypothetical protein F5884DRAFT_850727 [Xylogone sp. PMI_703]|nr:hypothetical protein F5884DRAFT_850727 [Xylogone sp. PMI_703]
MSFTHSRSQALTSLPPVHDLLNLANHRNKNQHRLSKWWKEFSQLRRHIGKLIAELSDPDLRFVHESSSTPPASSSKKKLKQEKIDRGNESRDRVERRVAFLEDILVPKCYMAFSNVVADNQYSALGLLLLGCLARVQKAIKPLRKSVEVETGLAVANDIPVPSKAGEIDLGEKISRDDVEGLRVETADVDVNVDVSRVDKEEEDEELTMKIKKKVKKVKHKSNNDEDRKDDADLNLPARPKKKRKKGDAFDSLFASLI